MDAIKQGLDAPGELRHDCFRFYRPRSPIKPAAESSLSPFHSPFEHAHTPLAIPLFQSSFAAVIMPRSFAK